MRPSSPRLALAVVFFVLALAVGFTLLPLSFGLVPAAHAQVHAQTGFTVTNTVGYPAGVVFIRPGDSRQLRERHTATLLPDGKVLVVGGSPATISNTTEVYNPTNYGFTNGSNPNWGRIGHTATLLPNGKVLIVGGRGNPGTAELYDSTTGTFSPTGALQNPRWAHTATLLPNGKVLIIGGIKPGSAAATDGSDYVPSAELYDPAAGTFTLTGAPMEARRYEHTATLLPDGRVLIAGGIFRVSTDFYSLSSTEFYDPSTGAFTAGQFMKRPRGSHTATLLSDGRVLFVGGFDYMDSQTPYRAEIHDWAAGVSTETGVTGARRIGHTATALSSGEVLVVGGCGGEYPNYSSITPPTTHSRNTEFYQLGTNSFTTLLTLQYARCYHTTTMLNSGDVLMVGGGNIANVVSTYRQANTVTGTLTLPSEFVNHTTIPLRFAGSGSPAAVRALAPKFDDAYPSASDFIPTGQNEPVVVTHTFPGEGKYPVWLYIKNTDGYNHIIRTEVKIDLRKPGSFIDPLPTTSTSNLISLSFRGSDSYSGLQGFEIQVREGLTGQWTSIPTGITTPRSGWTYYVPYYGLSGRTYYFRMRATDRAGNVEDWPATYDTMTQIAGSTSTNIFTGTIAVPQGWLQTNSGTVQFSGVSSGDNSGKPINAASLSNDGTNWGSWIATTPGVTKTLTWNFGSDGTNKPVYLRFRDTAGNIGVGAIGLVNVDTVPPSSSMTNLPPTSPGTVRLNWSGSDAASGVAAYDVEVRPGILGTWQSFLAGTTARSADFTGINGMTYYFRVRARDAAGRVEAWPTNYDTYTRMDTEGPVGSVNINDGALASTTRQVSLHVPASDALSPVRHVRARNENEAWGSWVTYGPGIPHTLSAGDGDKTVYVQFRDLHGNISVEASDTIRLDEAAGTDPDLFTMNEGALWTSSTTVTLKISAAARVTGMQISNDRGFAGAVWQPFDTRPTWELLPYQNYVIQRTVYVRVRSGLTIGPIRSDDIIYDPVPPTGNATIQSVDGSQLQVSLAATDSDNGSGVAAMRVALAGDFAQAEWEPFAESKRIVLGDLSPNDVQLVVQFRDGAGNVSERLCVTPDGTACAAGQQTFLWLPFVQRR